MISDQNDFSNFDLLVNSMLPIKFQDNRPFVLGEKAKKDFQDDSHGGNLGFPLGTSLAIFIYKSPRCFLPSFMSLGLRFRRRNEKTDFQDGGNRGHLGFPI